jgi:transcriptional regulator with XRE-family HTH domain
MKAPTKFFDMPCGSCGSPRAVVNGAWLRFVRKRAGLSLREFAVRAGVSAAYICDIEHNRRNCLPEMRKNYETFEGFAK